jgi:hypothetical protein
MKEKDSEEVQQEQERIEAHREGSAAALFAGLLILVLLAGSAVLISYFWPVFTSSRPNMPPPAAQEE